MNLFILDSNIFIEAKNNTYPFDIFPGFWEWLDQEKNKEHLVSTKSVYNKLTKGDDELSAWIKERKDSGWFLTEDDEITQKNYQKVAIWATNPENEFRERAYEEFLSVADSWLVAKAITENATIVTHERFQPGSKKRILIPNACKEFNVPYLNTLQLFRSIGATFSLK